MKRIMTVLLAVVFIAGLGTAQAKRRRKRKTKENVVQKIVKETGQFDVYTEKMSRMNHYIPSGYMGDYSDLKVNDRWKDQPRAGKTCIRIEYTPKMSQGAGWAGIYWQNPANNWGTRKGGYDLSGAKRITFWARGAEGGEALSEFKIGGITGEYSDTDTLAISDIELTKNWKRYEIDLSDADLTSIIGGFCWSANLDSNPDGVVFFLDDIIYEFTDKKSSKKEDKKKK